MKRYVALAPLPVDIGGERSVLEPGTIVPDELVAEWQERRAIFPLVDLGKLLEIDTELALEVLADDELLAECERRGIRPKARTKTAV